jgi:Cdc6-like AAA superfamily ATPase
MWKDFGTKFTGLLNSLTRHKELIERRASLAQYRIYREDMKEMKSHVDKIITEERAKKLMSVKEWLAVGSLVEEDHLEYGKIRQAYPSTGHWILKNDYIRDWVDADDPYTPVLWLTGIPGAGKTILASNIIDDCRKKSTFVTSFFYCHYEAQGMNSAVGVLRGLLYQLLEQYSQLLPHCHTKQTNSGEPSLRSMTIAKKLFEDFCMTVPKVFIIIDGLDECEQIERRQLLECLIDVVGQCDATEPGRLRIMIVSQSYQDIRKILHSSSVARVVPRIINLSLCDNESDIKTYVRSKVDRIVSKFELTDDIAEYLRNLTVTRSKGESL